MLVNLLWPFLILGVIGCLDETVNTDEPDDFLFVAHKAVDGERAVMEALFTGKVIVVDGCLRLDIDGGGAMVVWPPGYSYAEGVGGFNVRNELGVNVGKIGQDFRFGGGFVQTLQQDGPVDEALRQEALTRCPGEYWIVGEMYSTEESPDN